MSSLRTTASLLTMALSRVRPRSRNHTARALQVTPRARSRGTLNGSVSSTATTPLSSSPTAIAPQTTATGTMTTSPTNTAPVVTTTTSPATSSQDAPGSPPNLSSANPGAVDQNAVADPAKSGPRWRSRRVLVHYDLHHEPTIKRRRQRPAIKFLAQTAYSYRTLARPRVAQCPLSRTAQCPVRSPPAAVRLMPPAEDLPALTWARPGATCPNA